MGKPGAKKMDQIVSVTPGDVHIIMIPSPGGPVPTPIPHPCASMIKDKVATKVKVMGQPGAVKGSKSKHTPPHIPMGPGPFQKPPKNEGEIITGSANVFYEGKEAAMLGDTGKMCSDPSDTPVGKVIGTAATVLVGGGGGGSDEAREKASADAMKAASAACHKWINANMPAGAAREQAHRDVCSATGHPVDVATGKVFTAVNEVKLKGRIPLEVGRNYSSARPDKGPLGRAWRHSLEIELVKSHEFVALRDENGRFVPFAPPACGESVMAALGRDTLACADDGTYTLIKPTGRRFRFGNPRRSHEDALTMPLVAVEDGWGNQARLHYDEEHRLVRLTDPAGRTVYFVYGDNGLVSELRLQTSPELSAATVCRYTYSNDLLVQAEDAAGGRWYYAYDDHLLIRETDRSGDSFYFRYDKDEWCTETWGDGGLMHRHLAYDRAHGRTLVTNSLGYRRLYVWNEQGVVVDEIDHEGNELHFHYNKFIECVSECNALGHTWTYEYDAAGRRTKIETPNGTATEYAWDELGRLVGKTDYLGGAWIWSYSDDGRAVTRTDPLGQTTVETRDGRGDLVHILGADGREVRARYDDVGNVVEIVNGDGLRITRTHNAVGDILTEHDQYGERFATDYNALGFARFARFRGRGEKRFERDAEGRIVRLTSARGHVYEYTYLPYLDKVTHMRQVADVGGTDLHERHYRYDTEGRLVRLEIFGGETVEFAYGEHAQPARIRYGDGRERVFERDPRGVVSRYWENGALVFTQEADYAGRVVRRLTGDGEEYFFDYDAAGNLIEAVSDSDAAPLTLERDELGRIVAQRGGAGEFQFVYDPIGNCTGYRRGDDLAVGFAQASTPDVGGRTLVLTVNGRPAVDLAYDARERLIRAAYVEGDLHEFYYQDGDAPYQRRVTREGNERLREQLDYDAGGALVRCGRADGAATVWQRDRRGRLVAAREEAGGEVVAEARWRWDRAGDRVGATCPVGKEQAVVFAAHRPHKVDGATCEYDRRGRLVRRTDASGTTSFTWNCLNQLRQVELPGGEIFRYDYDVFGRRVAKRREAAVVRYDWIDNHLVHERSEDGENHYLYHARSFTPLACLAAQADRRWECRAVTTDDRGAPVAVTAPGGRDLWRAMVAPWGERTVLQADASMPLALPGQYADAETGFHYNNARYYDPATGTYISPDPVGLMGADHCFQYVTDPISLIDPLGLNPEHVAFGKTHVKRTFPGGITGTEQGVLDRFAQDPLGDGSVRAAMYEKFDPVLNENGDHNYEAEITNAMKDADAIYFNLDGLSDETVAEILADPDPSKQKPPLTRWELAMALTHHRGKTQFFEGAGNPSKRIPCAT